MPDFNSDSSRWRAVQTRDKSAHSAFVYAVVTTKIVCRPTCPSRLARRSNVKYYDTTTEALLDGFRSCKRCQPELLAELDHDASAAIVANTCRLIEDANGRVKLTQLAAATGFTTRHLHNLFRAKLGCTPAVYATQVRQVTEALESPFWQSFGVSIASTVTADSPHIDVYEDCPTSLDGSDFQILLGVDAKHFSVGLPRSQDERFTVNNGPEDSHLHDHSLHVPSESWMTRPFSEDLTYHVPLEDEILS